MLRKPHAIDTRCRCIQSSSKRAPFGFLTHGAAPAAQPDLLQPQPAVIPPEATRPEPAAPLSQSAQKPNEPLPLRRSERERHAPANLAEFELTKPKAAVAQGSSSSPAAPLAPVAASVRPLAVAAGAASDSDSEDDGDDAGSLPAPSSRPVRTRKQTNFYGMVAEGDIGAEGMAADRELEPEAAAMSAEALLPPEPRSYEESQASPEREQWQAAVESELQSLAQHNTFRLTRLPDGRRCIGSRWVLRRKYGADGQVTRYKARLVAKGYAQVKGVDYFESEIRAPALHPKALRAILSIVASLDYELKQMDVPTAFLNAVCKEDIYMKVPSGYPLPPGINAGAVLKLEKTLDGIKQATREWNIEYNNAIVALGYTRLSSDTCV